MMTYEEAMGQFVSISRTPRDRRRPTNVSVHDRYATMHDEIQTSEEAFALAESILHYCEINDLCMHVAMAMMLSHGVMVGIEMTKTDLDIGGIDANSPKFPA